MKTPRRRKELVIYVLLLMVVAVAGFIVRRCDLVKITFTAGDLLANLFIFLFTALAVEIIKEVVEEDGD